MSTAEAADVYCRLKPQLDALRAELEPAERTLKEYFQRTGKTSYRGRLAYKVTSFAAVSAALVRAKLGPAVAEVEEQRTREQLILL